MKKSANHRQLSCYRHLIHPVYHHHRLKVGVPIILMRNLSPKQGLCNGTRLQITRLTRNCIETRILGGDFDGELRLI